MEIIREIESKRDRNGKLVKWAIFLCLPCLQEVERRLTHGKKQKSCGCQSHPKPTEELRQKISKARKGKCLGENNPKYGKGDKQSGENNPMYGKKHTEEANKKNSESNKGKQSGENNPMYGVHRFGELSPNWSNGSSFLPYPPEFNKELKQSVLIRDNHICQCPNCEHKSNKLDIHHIDYNKQNNNLENLITLCAKCHSKTIGKNGRIFWLEFYKQIMLNKNVN